VGQQPVLGWVAGRVGGWDDEPAHSLASVLGDLADLRDVPELGRLAELALADRPGVRIDDRDQPVGDLEPPHTAIDLLGHPAAARCQLLELVRGRELGLRATTTGRGSHGGREALGFPG